MKLGQCKGFRDRSPQEMERFRFIAQAFRECCSGWGFSEVRTPTLEYLHLFTATGTLTPGMLGRVYSFLDWDGWSGQRVVLRPDGTIPVARFYIDNLAGKGLSKLFYLANIFRFEETGKESRELWQGGVELIGVSSPLADVELTAMALEVLGRVGVSGVGLRLSHAGIIRSLLSSLGLSPREQTRVFDQVLDGDADALAEIKTKRPRLGKALAALIELKGESAAALKEVRALFDHGLPEIIPHMDNMISVAELLEAVGISYRIDIASGRGFEYYTGLIFELYKDGRKLGGGGRYDALIPLMGGGDVPASGFALHLDHLMELVASDASPRPEAPRVLVRAEPSMIGQAFIIARRLREAGNVAELQLEDKEPAGFGWRLEVRAKAPLFVLTSRARRQRFELGEASEVLKLLEEGGCRLR
jgi:histidyl-tRNA synthetase